MLSKSATNSEALPSRLQVQEIAHAEYFILAKQGYGGAMEDSPCNTVFSSSKTFTAVRWALRRTAHFSV
jgi:hypothetical protein